MSIRFRFPAHIRLIDGGGDEGGSNDGGDGGEPRSFTQEQVDQIVEKRLAKERGKYKDYDELKSKAMKLDEMENAGKSEIDKLKESNAALRIYCPLPYAVHGNVRYLYRSIPVLFHQIERILSFEY